jgi:hypothetical protein
MRWRFAELAALLVLTTSILPARDYGLATGSKMPDFEAPDQDGNSRTLHSVLGPKGAVIVFFRSADW